MTSQLFHRLSYRKSKTMRFVKRLSLFFTKFVALLGKKKEEKNAIGVDFIGNVQKSKIILNKPFQ